MNEFATPNNDPLYQEALRRACQRVQGLRGFYVSASLYAVTIPFLWILNLTIGGKIWAVWPTLGWGIGLAIQGLSIFAGQSVFNTEWEEKKVEELMSKTRMGRKLA